MKNPRARAQRHGRYWRRIDMGQTGGSGDIFSLMVPIAAMLVFMYFLVFRPQQQRVKAHQALIANVRRGDVVVTAGGVIGKVTKADDLEVQIEIAEGVKIRVVKSTLVEVRSKSEPVPANANSPS
jgi:preprotein translocase subunit YajC